MTAKYETRFKREGSRNVVFILLAFSTALLIALLALTSVLAPQAKAQAQRDVGPVNPETGYPFWYQDDTGLRLEHCLDDPAVCGVEGLPNPDQPMSFPDNWPVETFWWGAEAAADTPGGGQALLVLNTEGTFINEEVRDGDQATFGRIRIRVDDLEQGATYRVTHPYGVETFENVVAGTRGINSSDDIGCLAPPAAGETFSCDFSLALDSRTFNGYLTWDTFGQSPENGGPPAGRVGDPNIPHAVTGSPEGTNSFKVEKMEENASGELVAVQIHAETDQFSVFGKIAEQTAVATPRGGEFDAAQQVTLTGSEPAGDIFYTLDGSAPTPASTPYTGPIDIPETATLKYIVVNGAGQQSEIFEQRYVITLPTDISLDSDSALLNFGQSTGFSGQILSNGEPLANKPVRLLQRPLGRDGFSPVPNGQLTTDAQGNFSLNGVSPNLSTIYRATFGGENEALQPSLSDAKRVNVRANVRLGVGKDNVQNGRRVGMGGVVRPLHNGDEVRLIINRNGKRIDVQTVTLDNRSRYRFAYRPPTIGNYAVRAVFPSQDIDHFRGFSTLERFRVTR